MWWPCSIRSLLHDINRKLDVLIGARASLFNMETSMAKTLNDILAQEQTVLDQVRSNSDLDDSILKIVQADAQKITDLKAQLDAAGTDPAKLQQLGDLMDQIAAQQNASAQKKVAAITANTPADDSAGANTQQLQPADQAQADQSGTTTDAPTSGGGNLGGARRSGR